MWLALTRPPWRPVNHTRFPPAFRLAARQLLLAAHRLSASSCTCCTAGAGGAGTGAVELAGQARPHLLAWLAWATSQGTS